MNLVFLILGGLFFLIGLVGLMLPVIPQIPFLAAGAVFMAAGSKRFRRMLKSSSLYRKHLKEHVDRNRFLSRLLKDDDMKTYDFYGWEQADVSPVTDICPGIETPRDLYDALSEIWCAETCAPRMRDDWTPENKTLGQCSVTAFLAQDLFGGEVRGIPRPDGAFHCYNVVGDCVFDLTSQQFGDEVLDYTDNPLQLREVHFAKEEKRLRYEYLKQSLLSRR